MRTNSEEEKGKWETFTHIRLRRVVKQLQRMSDARYKDLATMALTEADFGCQYNLIYIAIQ